MLIWWCLRLCVSHEEKLEVLLADKNENLVENKLQIDRDFESTCILIEWFDH